MPLDYTHEHLSSQVMQAGNPKTPISPSGGGGVSNPLTETLFTGDNAIAGAADGDTLGAEFFVEGGVAASSGGSITGVGGAGDADEAGGDAHFQGGHGNAGAGTGGVIELGGGQDDGRGGVVEMYGGNGAAGKRGGEVTLSGGIGNASVSSGASLDIQGGRQGTEGGSVALEAGGGAEGGSGGDVTISSGVGDGGASNAAQIVLTGGSTESDGKVEITAGELLLNGVPIFPQGGPLTQDLDAGGSNINNLTSLSGTVGNPLGIESDIDMDGNKITGLADPTNPQDATTQQYVDNLGEGLVVLAGNSGMRRVTIDLDAADIATLNSVSVEVVAAPGAFKVIVPVAASLHYVPGAVAFDNFAILGVGATGSSLQSGNVGFDGLSAQINSFASGAGLALGAGDQPLLLFASADPGGTGDGTARLTVLYYVMDLAS